MFQTAERINWHPVSHHECAGILNTYFQES